MKTMFVGIENTASICRGDILYFNESPSTLKEFHGCAIRVERIEDDKYIQAIVPDRSFVREVGVDSWNKILDFDGLRTHVEVGMNVSRLVQRFDKFELRSQELDSFLDEF